jgi:hypothetical protein
MTMVTGNPKELNMVTKGEEQSANLVKRTSDMLR